MVCLGGYIGDIYINFYGQYFCFILLTLKKIQILFSIQLFYLSGLASGALQTTEAEESQNSSFLKRGIVVAKLKPYSSAAS